MKKIVPLLFLCLAMLGCKKNPFDYRTKYIGKWEFVVQSHIAYPNSYKDTTYTTEGHIDYGQTKEQVHIYLSSGGSGYSIFTLHENGNLYYAGGGVYVGKFETKKKVSYSYTSGSLGGVVSSNVTGVKK